MAFRMRLGSYRFEWNPDEMTLPEMKKTVATQETYNGSAVFQWQPFLEGTPVELAWEWMSVGMYNSLRLKYLATDIVRWIAEPDKAFTVAVISLDGKYTETGLHEMPYRMDVRMRLNIRTTTSAITTTTV